MLQKSKFLWQHSLLLREETAELKVVSQDEHDECSDRAVAIVTTWVDLRFATEMFNQALCLKQNLRVFREENSRLVNQILMEFLNHNLDVITSLLHKG